MTTQLQEFAVISAVTGRSSTAMIEIEVPEQPEPTPEEARAALPPISRRQLRLTLVRNGIALDDVAAMIEGLPDGLSKDVARIEWEDAATFERMHPTLVNIGAGLGLSPEQIDELWVEALNA